MLIVGIDPGKYGGIVAIDQHSEIQYLQVMPDNLTDLLSIFRGLLARGIPLMVFLEKAQVFPHNGAVGMFHYGEHFGTLKSALQFVSMPYQLVPPQEWTRCMHVGCKKNQKSKEKSLEAMRRIFPDVSMLNPMSKRSRKPHEGLIDALLIAEYGRMKMKNWGKRRET